jgi:hypothetical protein
MYPGSSFFVAIGVGLEPRPECRGALAFRQLEKLALNLAANSVAREGPGGPGLSTSELDTAA